MSYGLNHIPLQQTGIYEIVEELLTAWSKIASLLKLNNEEIVLETTWLTTFFWNELRRAAHRNQGGFKVSNSGALSIGALKELR